MIQKLYSPVFCKMYTNEGYSDDTPEELSQRATANYAGEIKDLMKKMIMPGEEERGLTVYFSEKVNLLYINVEVLKNELWGMTEIDVPEPLNREEMRVLKDFVEGQMSDGFGESAEQREIKTEYGDLFVSLWTGGNRFFIDTAQEFSERTGTELPEITADTLDKIADLRSRLLAKIDKECDQYYINLHSFDEAKIAEKRDFTAAVGKAYVELQTCRNYTEEDLNLLLNLPLTLENVAVQFYEMREENIGLPQILEFLKDNYAEENIQNDKEVYLKSFEEAKESGEIELYRESLNKNIECAGAIDKAVHERYEGNYRYDLKSAAESVISDYGEERVRLVTARHLQKSNYDGRYSEANRNWAGTALMPPSDVYKSVYLNTHPTILDGFINQVKKITESQNIQNVFAYKIKQFVLFTDNRGIAYGESKSAVSPFVTWQFIIENGERDYFLGHYFKDKDSAINDFTHRFDDYIRRNNVKEVTEKPLTGMAKLRQSEKEKYNNAEPPMPKDKTKSKKSDLDL